MQTVNSRAYAMVVCCAGMMTLALAINLMPVLISILQHRVAGPGGQMMTQENLGRINSITFLGVLLGILVTGPLADRFGARRFALFGNACIAAGLLGLWTAGTYARLLLTSFTMGLGAGVLDMVLSPIVAAAMPDRKHSAMNWLHSFYCTGAAATILLSAYALRLGGSWQPVVLALTPLPLLVFVGFLFMRVPPMVAEGRSRQRTRDLLRAPYFRAALLAIFFGGAVELGMVYWLSFYTERHLGYAKLTGDLTLCAFNVAMAAGRISVGVVGPRWNAVTLMRVCCMATTVFLVLGCFLPVPPLALAACVLAGFWGSCLWPSMLGVTADRFPHGGASMFGLLAAAGNAGCVVMPWLVGLVADRTGRMDLGLATAGLCPLAMILLLGRLRHDPPPEPVRCARNAGYASD